MNGYGLTRLAGAEPGDAFEKEISNRIFTLRGLQVMLDRDLALFYGVKPIRLREQVKRNARRFPGDFMFQLDDKDVDDMVSQLAIPSRRHICSG